MRILKSLFVLFLPVMFAACGDDVTQINQTGIEAVDAEDDLPECTKDNENELVFVKEDLTARICTDGEWVAMNGESSVLPNDTLANDSERVAISLDSLAGFTQKGPFLKGSSVYLYELSDGRTLKQTNGNFTSKITSDDGRYKFSARNLVSQYAMVVVDGYYRNEVSGGISDAPIRLTALTDMRKRSSVNVNLLTHMEFDRVYSLVTLGDSTGKKLTVKQAKRQAQKEILKQFHIELGKNTDAEDMDVFGDSDADAALLAVSVLLQGDSSSSALSVLLTEISNDISGYGEWKNAASKARIADWAMKKDLDGGLAAIRANVEGWNISKTKAPAFEAPVRNFWKKELGVGECTKDKRGALFAIKDKKSAYYAAKDSVYTEGDNSLERLICDASGDTPAWRFASDLEKDVAAFGVASEGAVKRGSIDTTNVYVNDGSWHLGTELDKKFKACIETNKGMTDSMMVKREPVWYICDEDEDASGSYAWREATTAEADTALFGVPETQKDSVKVGNINKSHYYVYDGGKWRFGTDLDKALGACDTTKLNTLANLDGAADDPNAWYICVDNEYVVVEDYRLPATWRKATNYEMDTYGWDVETVAQGAVDSGKVNKNLTYVYEDSAWRQGTRLDRYLKQGCVQSRKDTLVQKAGLEWYTCVADTANDLSWSMEWRRIADTELDLAYWNYFRDSVGTILTAPSGKIRVWDADTLREPDAVENRFNRGCVSYMRGGVYEMDDGMIYLCDEAAWDTETRYFKDTRDSKFYKVVKIGDQTWMAENLNFETDSSFCYNNEESNCTKYGRLYRWAEAVGKSESECGSDVCSLPSGHIQGVCPNGWHLPSKTEWERLLNVAQGAGKAGKYLKSTFGWNDYQDISGNGTDDFGFSALPAGYCYGYGGFSGEGEYTGIWSSTERIFNSAYNIGIFDDGDDVVLYDDYKSYGYSVRCLQD